jgi:Tol biopolymer transport system component
MALALGTRLGPYEILSALGAGGMGEVYRARDSRLGRDVAIKVLPPAFSIDPERLHRFEQEARAAAALNHPSILAVFDIGQHDGAPFIVSELLEGDTLRELLHAGALSARKAIEYAIQIAHGLAAAHEKGIVHRDLKPENLFVTSDGRVKILDFGLAKLTETDLAQAGASDAATRADTDPGMVLGTLGYMAPEQLRSLPTDHRADIFAFGVALYEMLSGQRAFRRDTAIDTMTAILKQDPPDLPVADRNIPPALVRIVDRCLEKAPARRFQSTGDLAFALEALSSHTGPVPELTAAIQELPAARRRERLAWMLVAVLAVVAVAALAFGAMTYFRRPPVAVEATRFFVSPTDGWSLATQTQGGQPALGPLAVAPDGRQVAFVARKMSGGTLIWVRSLDTLTAKGLVGTEGGASPFWSPDSRSLGFFADGKLKKIEIAGGPAVTLCGAAPGISGSWSPDGLIVFSGAPATALQKVSASGGTPTAATVLGEGESAHARPAFLPDGRHFLYRANSANLATRAPTFVGSLDSTERMRLRDVDSTNVVYSQRHLLFLLEATLMAQPFDPERLVVSGEPFPIAEQIQRFGNPPYGFFSASDSGVLTYQTGTATGTPQLSWFDRTGKPLGSVGKPAPYGNVALARDGKRALVSLIDSQNGSDLWLLDLGRDGLATRFTFDPANQNAPLWSPDGSRLVFSSNRKGSFALYQKASSGAGSEEVLLAADTNMTATSWSSDGRFLLYTVLSRLSRSNDIWVLPLSGDKKPFPFLESPANEVEGQFSPDGRWISYTSTESGRNEVYVRSFPDAGGRWQVSTGGGGQSSWRPDGKEIFYVEVTPNPTLMAAAVSAQGAVFAVGVVAPLFRVRPPSTLGAYYQVSPDGNRFLINMTPDVPLAPTPITVVVNWTAGLKK